MRHDGFAGRRARWTLAGHRSKRLHLGRYMSWLLLVAWHGNLGTRSGMKRSTRACEISGHFHLNTSHGQ